MDKFNLIKEDDLIRFDESDYPLTPAKARNRGAFKAQGEVITFLDADCAASPNWLTILSQQFSDESTTVLGGGIDFISENFWALCNNLSLIHDYLPINPPGVMKQLPSANLSIRRSAFFDIGGFDERFPSQSGEDADLTVRLKLSGHKLRFEPSAYVTHTSGKNNFIDFLKRSYRQGMYSTKMDPRFASTEGLPWIFRSPGWVLFFSPLIAFGATLNIFRNSSMLRNYWYTILGIYISRISWCFGASKYPFRQSNK